MMNQRSMQFAAGGIFTSLFLTVCLAAQQAKPSVKPSTMPRMGSVDERFQSYNVEMVEVTGGRFWKPYDPQVDALLASQSAAREKGANQPAGMSPELYQYRPPIDLSSARLRKLAAALG